MVARQHPHSRGSDRAAGGVWHFLPAGSKAEQAFRTLIHDLRTAPGVEKLGYTANEAGLRIWVVTSHEDLEQAERFYLLERDYCRLPEAAPLELELVPRDLVDERKLPLFQPITIDA